jgi:hypothetical protein
VAVNVLSSSFSGQPRRGPWLYQTPRGSPTASEGCGPKVPRGRAPVRTKGEDTPTAEAPEYRLGRGSSGTMTAMSSSRDRWVVNPRTVSIPRWSTRVRMPFGGDSTPLRMPFAGAPTPYVRHSAVPRPPRACRSAMARPPYGYRSASADPVRIPFNRPSTLVRIPFGGPTAASPCETPQHHRPHSVAAAVSASAGLWSSSSSSEAVFARGG